MIVIHTTQSIYDCVIYSSLILFARRFLLDWRFSFAHRFAKVSHKCVFACHNYRALLATTNDVSLVPRLPSFFGTWKPGDEAT